MATVRERVLEWIGAAPAERLAEVEAQGRRRASRAYQEGYNEGLQDGNDEPVSGTLASYGYRRLGRGGGRDWSRVERQEACDTSWALYVSSYIGRRLMHIKRDHLVGRQVVVSADDDDLGELLEDFWERNQMRQRAPQYALQLFLFGEQLHKLHLSTTGDVNVGYLEPANIREVICHPEDSQTHVAVVYDYDVNRTRVYRVARKDRDSGEWVTLEAPLEDWEQALLGKHRRAEYDGLVLYTNINTASNAPRGFPDLLPVYDLIVAADEVLFALAEREQFAGYFSFDVAVEGGPEEVDMRARALRQSGPPPRGSLNVHNAAEVWTIHAPDLKQVGSIETFRALLGTILGSLGFPVHWYGFGDDANRATAAAQSDPTHRSLEHDQGVVADMLLSMLEFQRDMSGGSWEEGGISLVLPELSAVDLGRVAQAMMPIITAGLTAGDAGLMTRQTLATMLGKLLRELDVEYDPAAELAEVDSQTLTTAQADNDALVGSLNGNDG